MKKINLLLCAGLLMLSTACSSNPSASSPTPQTAQNAITVAVGSQITTLDPGYNTETVNNYILAHTVSSLMTKDENGTVIPELAEDYTVSEDGLTYTVTLKEGLTWSDGQALTSQDFKYAILRNLTYGADNSWAIYNLTTYLKGAEEIASNTNLDASAIEIEGVETPDDSTLVLNLKQPCAFFVNLLTGNVWAPLRADFADAHDSTWALKPGYPSIGAYQLAECNENEKAVIVKNDSYYKADEITLDQITFLVMPDSDAQSLAYKNGEIDVALNVPVDVGVNYPNQNEVWNIPSPTSYFIALNSGATAPEALKEAKVRKALAISIDKQALASTLGPEQYYQALGGYVPAGLNGIDQDFRKEADAKGTMQAYDPEQAKALLKEAGYDETHPLKIKYKYSSSFIHSDVAQILEAMWKNIGIDCELEVVESGVFYNQIDNGDFELSRYGYTASDDPSQFLTLWTTGQQVVAAVDDPAYDKMVAEASALIDHTEYMEALHAVEEFVVEEESYVIPLFSYNTPILKSEKIQNATKKGTTPFYGYVTLQ